MNQASRVSIAVVLAAACGLSFWTGGLQAKQLNLTQQPPDIYSGGILVQYNAATDALMAVGSAATLDLDGGATADYNIIDGTFDLTAAIDDAGGASGGSLAIGGTIPELGATSGSLLTGSLVQFGFPEMAGAQTLDFVFEVTGGDLASLYGGGGGGAGGIGVWLHDTGFEGTFASDFDSDPFDIGFGMACADAFYPEPSMTALLLSAVAALLCWRRRAV